MEARQDFSMTIILFGSTGDLARRKIIPSLGIFFHETAKQKRKNIQLIMVGRKEFTRTEHESFLEKIFEEKKDFSEQEKKDFFKKTIYVKSAITDFDEGYRNLEAYCKNSQKILFSIATPPNLYEPIIENISKLDCVQKGYGRKKVNIMIEKPFGYSYAHARKIDKMLKKAFSEEQIFRVDHYLAKQTVKNIITFRFSNAFFEPVFNRKRVEAVHIQILEAGDVALRTGFYDDVGALRDVGQSHLLQLLALIAMEPPTQNSVDTIRAKRAEVIKRMRIDDSKKGNVWSVRGQYANYRVKETPTEHSTTETYFLIRCSIDNNRWKGVPFFIESGKSMEVSRAAITITLSHPKSCMYGKKKCNKRNTITYEIQPDEKIAISLCVEDRDGKGKIAQKDFIFDYKKELSGRTSPDAYTRLFEEIRSGNQTLFVSMDEMEASWKFIDRIIESWSGAGAAHLLSYKKENARKMREKALAMLQ